MFPGRHLLAAAVIIALAFVVASRRELQGVGTGANNVVALLDVGFVLENHARLNQALAKLGDEVRVSEEKLQLANHELQKMVANSNELKAGSPEWKTLEEQIARRRTQLDLEFGNQRKNFYQQESNLYFEVSQEINQVVQRYADQNGLRLVLRVNRAPVDVTSRQSVLNDINKEVIFSREADITTAILDEVKRSAAPMATSPRP